MSKREISERFKKTFGPFLSVQEKKFMEKKLSISFISKISRNVQTFISKIILFNFLEKVFSSLALSRSTSLSLSISLEKVAPQVATTTALSSKSSC